MRSFLFVPADSERKMAKGLHSGADALILDLEDSVAAARKDVARAMAVGFLAQHGADAAAALYVRINPLDSGLALTDLAAVVGPHLAGVMLPKAQGVADVLRLGHYLDALEVRAGLPRGIVKVLPVATETPQALLQMGGYQGQVPRLAGITWGAEDLSAAVGALDNRDDGGGYAPLYTWAGALCLCAAAATGVPAIDTVYTDFRDQAGLAAYCRASRRRGYSGCLAIHPDQIATLHAAYSPSEAEMARAQRIVDAFAAQPGVGTLSLDGVMVDLPHLKQAQRTLASRR